MSKIYQFQTEDQIHDEASLWVARLDRGLSEVETKDLRHWLARSSAHRECLLEMAHLWDRMDSLSILSELFDTPVIQPQAARGFGHMAWAAAASVLVLVFAANLLVSEAPWENPAGKDQPQLAGAETSNTLYETGIGAHSTVNLPDGTRILLNTNTLVSVTYTTSERLLVLKRGELHVEVAHDKQRPLRVQVGNKVVEAVGTAFNVYLKDDQDFDLIVTEGRVHVKPVQDAPEVLAATGQPEAVQELVQGQKLSVRATQPAAVEAIASAVIEDKLSWRDGNLVFRGETLQDALNELSRYTPDSFKVVDPRISGVRIAGLYKAGDVEGLLMALRENFNIDHRRTADGVIELSLKQDAPVGRWEG